MEAKTIEEPTIATDEDKPAKVDFTKPVETIPCDNNPIPIACRVDAINYQAHTAKVSLMGDWYDTNGDNLGFEACKRGWLASAQGGYLFAADCELRNA